MKIKSLAIFFLCALCFMQASAQKKGFVVNPSIVATSHNISIQELDLILQEKYHVIGILPHVKDFDKAVENVNRRALNDSIYINMKAYQFDVSYDYSKPTLLRDKLTQEGYYYICDFEISDSLLSVFKRLSSAVEISRFKEVPYGDSLKYLYRFSLKGACPTASYIEAYYPVWKSILNEHNKRIEAARVSVAPPEVVINNSDSISNVGQEEKNNFVLIHSLRVLLEPLSELKGRLKNNYLGDWNYNNESISIEKVLFSKFNSGHIFLYSAGVELAASKIEVNSDSGVFEFETFSNSNFYTRRTYWRGLKEEYKQSALKIPITIGYGYEFSKRFLGIFEVGIAPSLSLYNNSKIKEGTFDFRGYFSGQDIELSNILQFGFVDNRVFQDYKISLKSKQILLEFRLKADFNYLLTDRLSLTSQIVFNHAPYPFFKESQENYWFGNAEYYGLLNNSVINTMNFFSLKIGMTFKIK
jgi:hypothetical protein